MTRPDFFIVGAPKSGTTAMYEYLGRHPEIFVPDRKEIPFFGHDLHLRWPRPTLDQYLAYFAPARRDQLVGAAYVWCLFSASAADEIKELVPDAKIVIMLRKPVDAMLALHSEGLYNGNEDITDFEAAIAAEAERRQGRRIPMSAHLPEGLWYRAVYDYPAQVARYLDAFGPHAVHVIIFDDFIADTAGTYRKALEFLGVDPSFVTRFPVVNANKRVRNEAVRDLLARPPARLRRMIRRSVPQPVRRRAYSWAVDKNTRSLARRPMDPDVRQVLLAEMAGSVDRLADLLGRDLRAWNE